MEIQTNELTGAALDWAVAKCEGLPLKDGYSPSTNWAQGGPIIEREKIELEERESFSRWLASNPSATLVYNGKTPLIAAMRCYVASELGDTVEVPRSLL